MPKQWLQAPIDNLETLLASAAAVRTFLGAADATEAKNSIYQERASGLPPKVAGVTTGGAGAAAFRVAGDKSGLLGVNQTLRVRNSTGNDGVYTVRTGVAFAAGETTIPVEEAVSDGTADGELELQYFPRITIGSLGGRSHRRVSNKDWRDSGGQLFAVFEQQTPDAYWDPDERLDNPTAAAAAFLGTIEDILDELQDLEGVNGALHVFAMEDLSGPVEIHPDDNFGHPAWWQQIGFETAAGGAA